MKEILLTQNKVALVDDDDFERLNRFKWYAARKRQAWYAVRTDCLNGRHKTIHMHREILNTKKGIQVDHRNGNGLDNCKENLRHSTHAQNMHNKKQPHKNNKLGIKGVWWSKCCKKFQAGIQINGKQIHLGLFSSLKMAQWAYEKAEKQYFGEFARVI